MFKRSHKSSRYKYEEFNTTRRHAGSNINGGAGIIAYCTHQCGGISVLPSELLHWPFTTHRSEVCRSHCRSLRLRWGPDLLSRLTLVTPLTLALSTGLESRKSLLLRRGLLGRLGLPRWTKVALHLWWKGGRFPSRIPRSLLSSSGHVSQSKQRRERKWVPHHCLHHPWFSRGERAIP